MGPIVTQVWVLLPHENGVVIVVTGLKPSCTHVDWCKFCVHLRSLIVRHFWKIETMGFKSTTSRSTPKPWPLLNFMKSTHWFKSYYGGGGHKRTDRQHGDLISFTFHFNLPPGWSLQCHKLFSLSLNIGRPSVLQTEIVDINNICISVTYRFWKYE
jgi:hypothetical protein